MAPEVYTPEQCHRQWELMCNIDKKFREVLALGACTRVEREVWTFSPDGTKEYDTETSLTSNYEGSLSERQRLGAIRLLLNRCLREDIWELYRIYAPEWPLKDVFNVEDWCEEYSHRMPPDIHREDDMTNWTNVYDAIVYTLNGKLKREIDAKGRHSISEYWGVEVGRAVAAIYRLSLYAKSIPRLYGVSRYR